MNINNNEVDKEHVLQLIEENKIIAAIKYVREITNIGLKDAKNIVDNLSKNNHFYDGENHIFKERNSLINTIKKNKKRKGNHVIKKSNHLYKISLFFILIVVLCFYFLMSNKVS